ncbi:FRS2 [Cordylochernes scorpioides]|uniref:FRS2 n=1 Tax=Cordylochernes scorpioides TaxID=51811 RepID=A0ABY6KF91_9ARAC|nr:FRS2 [Cordylochernes scorpioides]
MLAYHIGHVEGFYQMARLINFNRLLFNAVHSVIYRLQAVRNVNEEGRTVSSGWLQVTPTELIFQRRGKSSPVYWPLRSLRRYGFDSMLFSFECGRRCPTGPGIYAFRCRKAEDLFNVLQAAIQCPEESMLPVEENGAALNLAEARYSTIMENPFYVNMPHSPPGLLRARAHTMPTGSLSRAREVYVNVASSSQVNSPTETVPVLVNGDPAIAAAVEPASQEEEDEGINYITLDLDQNEGPSTTTQSPPPQATGGYATIDFTKTAALSSSVQDHRTRFLQHDD